MGIKELNEIIGSLENIIYAKVKKLTKNDVKTITNAQELIVKANKSYYLDSEELMSDFMYDRLKKLTVQVEEIFPELKSNLDNIVGAGITLGDKVKHIVPML